MDLSIWGSQASAITDGQVPPYVHRPTLDDQIDRALHRASTAESRNLWDRIVVVAGNPKRGKTRSLLEGVGRTCAGMILIEPNPHDLNDVIAAVHTGKAGRSSDTRWLVLLDDLQRWIRNGWVTEAKLAHLVGDLADVTVAVTVWKQDITGGTQGLLGSGIDPLFANQLAATAILLPDELDKQEREEAATHFPDTSEEDLGFLPAYLASRIELKRQAARHMHGASNAGILVEALVDASRIAPSGIDGEGLRLLWKERHRSHRPTAQPLSADFTMALSKLQEPIADRTVHAICQWSDDHGYALHETVIKHLQAIVPALSSLITVAERRGTESLLAGAENAFWSSDFDRAESWYRRAATLGSTAAMAVLGLLLERRGELAEAEVWYRQAADDRPEARFRLAGVLSKRGDHVEAETWLRSIISNDDGLVEVAMTSLILLLRDRGDHDEARNWGRTLSARLDRLRPKLDIATAAAPLFPGGSFGGDLVGEDG